MDILIAGLLVIIAGGLFLKQPIKIEFMHKHEIINPPVQPGSITDEEQRKIDAESKQLYEAFAKTMQEVMGVNTDGE